MLMKLAARPCSCSRCWLPGPAYTPKGAADTYDAGCPALPTDPRVQLMLMMLAAPFFKGAADAHDAGCPARPHAQGRS